MNKRTLRELVVALEFHQARPHRTLTSPLSWVCKVSRGRPCAIKKYSGPDTPLTVATFMHFSKETLSVQRTEIG